MVLPRGSGALLPRLIDGKLRHGLGLRAAMRLEPLGDAGIGEREDGGRQKGGIRGARLADGERADGDAGGHLDDGEQAVLAAEGA